VDDLKLSGRDAIVLGERDGIGGPALAAIIESSGGRVILAKTECFV
jgi:betaine reductase